MALGPMLAMGGIAALTDAFQEPRRRREADELARQYEEAQEAARRASLGRYGQIVRGYEGMARRGRETRRGVGRQARADITRGHAARLGGISQQMVSRGLAGTTVGASLRGGAERERVGALGRLEEGLSSRRMAMEQGVERARLGAVERRTDVGPDYGEMARTAQMRGQQGAFGGPAFGTFMQNLPMLYAMSGGGRQQPGTDGNFKWPGSRYGIRSRRF